MKNFLRWNIRTMYPKTNRIGCLHVQRGVSVVEQMAIANRLDVDYQEFNINYGRKEQIWFTISAVGQALGPPLSNHHR